MHGHFGILHHHRHPGAHAWHLADLVRPLARIDSAMVALFVLLCLVWGLILYSMLEAAGT